MIRLLFIVGGLAVALYWFNRWSSQSGPNRIAQSLRQLVVPMIALLLLLLTIWGGANLTLPLLALLIPLLMRWKSLWQTAPADIRGSADSSSNVETRFLRMSLDHGSGEMEGTVIQGCFEGQRLNDLNLKQLLALWGECQVDPQSVAVLEAYLDRTQSADWRDKVDSRQAETDEEEVSGARVETAMDRKQAYEILGLQLGAGYDEIKAAHRRLMQKVHPDHGGSTYLAARINQAKDFLLR